MKKQSLLHLPCPQTNNGQRVSLGICRGDSVMTYQDQIKSPKWQKKRLEILERDDFTCQSCGMNDVQLHVHHLAYHKDKMIWEYPDELLTTQCENCHADITSKISELKSTIQSKMISIDHATEYYNTIKLILEFDFYKLPQVRKILEGCHE